MIYKIIGFVFAFLTTFNVANAGIFPNDAIGGSLDSYNANTCTSSSSVLVPASSSTRTVLYLHVDDKTCKTNANSCSDTHIGEGGVSWPNGLYLDTEGEGFEDIYIWQTLPANKPIYCYKSISANHVFFSWIITNYNLASTTDQFYCQNCQSVTSTASTTYPIAPTSTIASTTPNTIGIMWTLIEFLTGLFKQYWIYILVIGLVFGFAVGLKNKLLKITKLK